MLDTALADILKYEFKFFVKEKDSNNVYDYMKSLFHESRYLYFGEMSHTNNKFLTFNITIETASLESVAKFDTIIRHALNHFREKDIELYYQIYLPASVE